MTRFSHKQWIRLNQLAGDLHNARSKEEVVELAVEELPRVLDSAWCGWNEHNDQIQIRRAYRSRSHHQFVVDYAPLVNPLMWSHPVVEGLKLRRELTLNDGVFSLTDLKSIRELRSVPIWRDVFRHTEAKHQLVAQLHVCKNFGVGLTVNGDRAFSCEQRGMLELLKRHFGIA